MASPTCGDHGMHLRRAIDAEDSDLAIFAKLGSGVRLALDFVVDLGAGGKEAAVSEKVLWGAGSEQGVPCGPDVEFGGSPR